MSTFNLEIKNDSSTITVLTYSLIQTTRRLTFDILFQNLECQYHGEDDGPFWTFRASNGYEVISRSRMDIQTERLWLLGGKNDERSVRSGTMTFGSNEDRDAAFIGFQLALKEWGDELIKTKFLLCHGAAIEKAI